MIYIKTPLGKTEFQEKSLTFTPPQRSAFILFDGTRTVKSVIEMTAAFGVTTVDIDRMVAAGVLALSEVVVSAKTTASAPTLSALAPVSAEKAKLDEQVQYAKAYLIAVRLTSNLGIRGFRLNLSVESAGNLSELKEVAPKIKAAIGADKFKELEDALYR